MWEKALQYLSYVSWPLQTVAVESVTVSAEGGAQLALVGYPLLSASAWEDATGLQKKVMRLVPSRGTSADAATGRRIRLMTVAHVVRNK